MPVAQRAHRVITLLVGADPQNIRLHGLVFQSAGKGPPTEPYKIIRVVPATGLPQPHEIIGPILSSLISVQGAPLGDNAPKRIAAQPVAHPFSEPLVNHPQPLADEIRSLPRQILCLVLVVRYVK